jgi:putative transposase
VSEYHHSGHAVWDIKYHLVWITKYRYKVLRGEVAERARDLLREICAAREVRIVRGAASPDHIHMLVVVPPQLAPAKLVQFLKGRSSRMLQRDFQHLRKRLACGGCGIELFSRQVATSSSRRAYDGTPTYSERTDSLPSTPYGEQR